MPVFTENKHSIEKDAGYKYLFSDRGCMKNWMD